MAPQKTDGPKKAAITFRPQEEDKHTETVYGEAQMFIQMKQTMPKFYTASSGMSFK